MSSKVSSKKAIHWLSSGGNHLHHRRAELLQELHFDVLFSPTVEHSLTQYFQRKSGIFIVSDFGDPAEVQQAIAKVSQHPETQGVKFVYCYSQYSESSADTAAINAFRDIIPDELDDKSWIDRLLFAIGESFNTGDFRTLSIATQEIASIKIPARIISIGRSSIRIESRLSATSGDRISISGPLASALGQKRLNLVVTSTDRRDLNFRFSDSITGQWQVPIESETKSRQLVEKLQQHHSSRRLKVFIATKDLSTRRQLTGQLDSLRFDIHVALQVNSLINEPTYIGPHAIIIDEALLAVVKDNILLRMCQSFPEHSTVIVIGAKGEGFNRLQIAAPDLQVRIHQSAIIDDFSRLLLNEYLRPETKNYITNKENLAFIPIDHPYSTAEVSIPSRVINAHPNFLTLCSTTRIQKYGLVKIESPFVQKVLGFEPYIKIVEIHSSNGSTDERFPFVQTGRISELDSSRSKSFREMLVKFFAEGLKVRNIDSSTIDPELLAGLSRRDSILNQEPQLTKGYHGGIQEIEILPFQQDQIKQAPNNAQLMRDQERQKKAEARAAEDRIKQRSKTSKSFDTRIVEAFASTPFRSVSTFIIVSLIFFAFIAIFVEYIQPEWTKSHNEFTDKFMKLDPEKYGLPSPQPDNADGL